jgi:hypothetical protein
MFPSRLGVDRVHKFHRPDGCGIVLVKLQRVDKPPSRMGPAGVRISLRKGEGMENRKPFAAIQRFDSLSAKRASQPEVSLAWADGAFLISPSPIVRQIRLKFWCGLPINLCACRIHNVNPGDEVRRRRLPSCLKTPLTKRAQ